MKEEIIGRLDKRSIESSNISPNEKSSESHNALETYEIARCVFEVFMFAHESRSGLININAGTNRLILRLGIV